ncbi:MAG: nucleotide exchange factor GrpE [Chloroflexi bacterium]|nr:nucleotide exchange factor GrpE [Chloroflexota bacterium]
MNVNSPGPSEQETPAATGETGAPAEEQAAALEAALREKEDLHNSLLRAQADFANYRKRVEQEREGLRHMAAADIIAALLPVLDDMDMAMANVPPKETGSSWVEGVRLVQRKLRGALESAGLRPIDAEGKTFDPWEHEAVMHDETGEHAEGTVVHVARPGYKLHGRVLRPAQVVVARKRQTAEEPSPQGYKETGGG